jgi:hypothetical protein
MKLKTNDEKSVKSHQVYINQSMFNITTELFFLQTFALVFVVINIFAIAGCSLPSLCYILLIQHQSTPLKDGRLHPAIAKILITTNTRAKV